MKKMKSFMVVHRDPKVSWDKVEENWARMVDLEPATWVRTYFNKEEKVRYCLWLAPDEEALRKIFSEFNISWESILRVEETVPGIWERLYLAQMEDDEKADTVTDSNMLSQ
jgi:hypothetical protein